MLEFQQKYIEDAGELISKLESELIDFENDVENEAIVQELFRVMHTLKGSAGMFGFQRIEEFTHILEDIYDLIRHKQLVVDRDILNLTFESIDLLKDLLFSKENLSQEQECKYSEALNLAKKFSSKQYKSVDVEKKEQSSGVLLYKIFIKPDSTVLMRGIKPIDIVDELVTLGKNVKFNFTDDNIDVNDSKLFNQYWEIFLPGTVKFDQITDVFMFLNESEYTIETLSEKTDTAIEQFLAKSESAKNNIDLENLKKQINDIIGISDKKNIQTKEKQDVQVTKKHNSKITDDSIRVSAVKLDNLLNLVSELIMVHAQFENHSERIQDERLDKTVQDLSKISRNFRDEILSTRLIPIAVLSTSMQRLVRDLAQKLGKEVELITECLNTEKDKNIISRIETPLMHVIRNCIDHGIEKPDERLKNNKERLGKLRFIAFCSGASVFIQIQDDGKGIDTKKIAEKAVAKGIIKYDAVLTNKQVYDLMFIPGFSTATEVTEVSGRGVGLDIVKNVITELHGEINVDSEIGLGTSFTFKLPLTLSIVDALLVYSNMYKILIPTSNILICKYLTSDYFNEKNLQYQFEKKCVPIMRLSEKLTSSPQKTDFEVLIIFSIYEKYYGILVDRIVTSLQAVIKPLGHMHGEQPYFIGASQLGDGSMAYVLDTNFLLKN